jgi:hypothetical protein
MITLGNEILLSPSFNEKMTASFEGGGGLVLTPKNTFVKKLASWRRGHDCRDV